jgi:poly(3-hydroxybutyrate) depolymerase
MMAGGAAPAMMVKSSKDPTLPAVTGECPAIKEGSYPMDYMGLKGLLWEVGPKKTGTGSLIFYWHGTGLPNSEYSFMFPPQALADLKAKGGILVSPDSGTNTGGDCSGTGIFAMDDFKTADNIAACAVKNWGIDPHRIYATGCSAGGLQSGCMAMMRSSYMAAAVTNSGGEVFPIPQSDRTHMAALMTIHGAPGVDMVIVDFNETSKVIDDAVKAGGGFAIDCNHGGGHCSAPADAYMAGWQFMQDHPFGFEKEPYGGTLPAIFPKYCKIW